MRIAQGQLGEVVLIDIARGLALGKSLDMQDASGLLKINYKVKGSEDILEIKDSDIVVITAGLTRKPGMTREELLLKNARILREVSLTVKNHCRQAIVIVVTNPLDAMTYLALKTTGFNPSKVMGMGVSLDAARFANLISEELKIPVSDIEAMVIGSHGEAMIPLARFTYIKGVKLDEFIDDKKIEALINRTRERGKEIISLLGSGSAYFAPSAAIEEIVAALVKDQKRSLGVCTYLNGEYGLKDICLGLPCILGRQGVEKIIELELNQEEKAALLKSASALRGLTQQLSQ